MFRKSQQNVQNIFAQFSFFQGRYASIRTTGSSSERISRKVPLYERSDLKADEPLVPGFFVRTIGSSYRKWIAVLEQHPELRTLKRKDVEKSAETLKSLNYSLDEIISKPMVLYNNALTLINRYAVLRECGFEVIPISLLGKYVTVMNKTVTFLKSHGHIPFSVDVKSNLKSIFTDVELDVPATCDCDENSELKVLRQQILNVYLRQRLDMTNADIEKVWRVYSRVRHKSFKSVQNMIQLLEELQFSKERITKNAYLLYGDVENARSIIREVQTIDGHDIREIIYRRPKILMTSCESLRKSIDTVKSFGIGEEAIIRCLEVLTLGPDTILERLRDLNEIEEFKVLGTNPRVLRLVHYQNKARLRLEYLNQLKVRCASLHILSCGSDAFAKFARDGSDRTKGRDIVVYLSNVMGIEENAIRNHLSRHPNWCHIPATHVKQCYDFLISKNFDVESIFRNIHLLLYPLKRIEEKLGMLYQSTFLEEINVNVNILGLSNNEILTLILYLIECEFHFTGDGIWTEQHTQQVENFNNLLPDFPESLNKIYKYGVKPAAVNDKVILQN